ncbi:MAG: SCO family protein [Caldilineaceae bacterium]
MKRLILSLLVLLSVLAGCAPQHEFAGPLLSAPQPVPAQPLMSADGPVSLRDFAGRYLFVYFGYTFCPDVCPLTLLTLNDVRVGMADKADQVQVVMISVDPERDTPEVLDRYVQYFDDSFIGITGAKAEIDAVGAPFGIYYEKGEGSAATGYLVNHSARIYLVDPNGNARIAYPHGVTAEEIIADLEYLFRTEQ